MIVATAALFTPLTSAQVTHSQKASACGPLVGQTLSCPRFGFTYKVAFGWVDRTAEMNADASASPDVNSDQVENSQANKNPQAPPSSTGSETLLAAFERPPGASGETINSAVVIAAEPLANYREVKTAADYFGAIIELADRRGFKATSDPYAFTIGTKQLVRGDFSKQRDKLDMLQTSLVMIEKGYIVSFTFIGGSQDEVNDLIANLGFTARPHRTPSK